MGPDAALGAGAANSIVAATTAAAIEAKRRKVILSLSHLEIQNSQSTLKREDAFAPGFPKALSEQTSDGAVLRRARERDTRRTALTTSCTRGMSDHAPAAYADPPAVAEAVIVGGTVSIRGERVFVASTLPATSVE